MLGRWPGDGLGPGLILDGWLVRGASGFAGVLAHTHAVFMVGNLGKLCSRPPGVRKPRVFRFQEAYV